MVEKHGIALNESFFKFFKQCVWTNLGMGSLRTNNFFTC